MFLSQARLTRGPACRRRRRSQRRARAEASSPPPAGRRSSSPRPRSTTRSRSARTHVTADAAGADRASRHRGDRRGDRHPRGRHRPCARKRSSTASTSSWSTSRPTRSPGPLLARKAQGRGRGLQPRLGRPAGADLRARRLGARRGLQGGRGRQGHALRAALSPLQSRQRLGHPRQVPEHHRPQVDQSEDVQLVRRRHQVRHRDDRGVQRHRPGAADPRAWAFRRRRASSSPRSASRRARAARWRRRASPRSRRRSTATAATCRIISRSAPTS